MDNLGDSSGGGTCADGADSVQPDGIVVDCGYLHRADVPAGGVDVLCRVPQGCLESKILGWPIFKVGAVALAVQVVLGFALMGLAALCPAWVTVLAEVLIFAVTGICLTVKDAARMVVSQSEAHMADSTAAWKVIRQKANALAASGDADMKRLAEEIRFADPMPTSLDGEIAAQVDALAAGKNPEAIRRLMAALAQRKVIAKQEKAEK